MTGTVEAIYIAPVAAGATQAVLEAEALQGGGLEGDRYAGGAGTFSDRPLDHELTLIEAEVIESAAEQQGMALAPGESRRNITTRGIALNPLVGKRFRVGAALCEGTRLCEPCAHLEHLTGRPGLVRTLAGRGGLRAVILSGGTIRVGDPVTVEAS